MINYMYVIIPIVVFVILVIIALSMRKPKEKKSTKKKITKKDKSAILKKTTKKLSKNPKDPHALKDLGELYFEEGDYEKAMRAYSVLSDQVSNRSHGEKFDIYLKYGISLLKTGHRDEAFMALLDAYELEKDSFEVNFNLGYIEYLNGNYVKALSYLRIAKTLNASHSNTLRIMGLCYYKEQKTADAISHLKRVIEMNPDDRECLFALAQCYNLNGQKDMALKLFSQLRADSNWGPLAALNSGKICLHYNQYNNAAGHFEIGLKHNKIPAATKFELKYYLANIYIKEQNLTRAITLLKEIAEIKPDYKDTKQLIAKYSDLVANNNLRIFLMGGNSEFANICRKLASNSFKNAHMKVIDMNIVKNLYLDIIIEVNTRKWEDIVLFRFIRNTGQVSDLLVRELHAKLKEEKAGRAFCFTAGFFTEEAKRFVEARLIDLVERDKLEKMLKSIEPEFL
ncbi:MAG: tetratricopeptide repeat protein [Spirochaetales bacterium]|nr:tetratricopeptide repeat protein [Spirochaetales bacterium]